jgi:hypothetical protein
LSQAVLTAHEVMYADILSERTRDAAFVPTAVSAIPLVRMSRRLAGAYTLDSSESRVHQPDSIGMTGDWRKRGPAYEIPYGALYGADFSNLLVAGRDISVTDAMWDITRVIPPCAVTGQAAGVAAALAAEGADVRSLDIALLQRRLTLQGVKLHL